MTPAVSSLTRFCRLLLGAAGLLWAGAALQAQTAITSITTTTSDLSNTTVNNTTFERTTVAVNTFTDANGNTYTVNGVASEAYIRRNTNVGNDNNTSVWYAQDPNNSSRFQSGYSSDANTLLLGNNILRGSDNTFANGVDVNTGNVERLDFILNPNGVTATSTMSFAVFDRGEVGVHDGFKIALITGWNSNTDTVTSYGGNLVGATSTNYGSNNVVTTFDYNLFRYSNGNNLGSSAYWDSNDETGSQGIGGVVISLADLGIAPGTVIYGYSIMAYDTTNGGSMSNLVNWNNTNYYPSSTTGDTGTGGIDLAAVNGVLFDKHPVPEPSTYGAILVGAAAVLGFWYRRRQSQIATAC